jgi:hypothetical protein
MRVKKRFRRLPAIVVIPLLATAAFVALAAVVQAIREDSWAPILAIGWFPAVLIASFPVPASGRSCRSRFRSLVRH